MTWIFHVLDMKSIWTHNPRYNDIMYCTSNGYYKEAHKNIWEPIILGFQMWATHTPAAKPIHRFSMGRPAGAITHDLEVFTFMADKLSTPRQTTKRFLSTTGHRRFWSLAQGYHFFFMYTSLLVCMLLQRLIPLMNMELLCMRPINQSINK